MSIATELKTARQKIESPENWCRADYTRDNRMCALASLGMTLACGKEYTPAMNALHDACQELYGLTALVTNETRGHAAVLRAFDKAIANALAEPRVETRPRMKIAA